MSSPTERKSSANSLIHSFVSELLYYLQCEWRGHRHWYDSLLRGSQPDPALLVLWAGIFTVSLQWGEYICSGRAFLQSRTHDVPVRVSRIFESLVCARHNAKYLMSVISVTVKRYRCHLDQKNRGLPFRGMSPRKGN